jgi:hypothetical protein
MHQRRKLSAKGDQIVSEAAHDGIAGPQCRSQAEHGDRGGFQGEFMGCHCNARRWPLGLQRLAAAVAGKLAASIVMQAFPFCEAEHNAGMGDFS